MKWITVFCLVSCSVGCGGGSSPAFRQAGLFDGATAFISVTEGATKLAMNSPFTIETYVQPSSSPASGLGTLFSAGYGQGAANGGSIQLYLDSNLLLNGLFTSCGGGTTFMATSTKPLSVGSYYHIAMTSDGAGHLTLFINGKPQVTSVATPASTACTFDTLMAGASIANGAGTPLVQVPIDYFGGTLDEMRFSKSVRYTSSFTVPSAPFTSDANTILLLHFDFNTSVSALGPGDFLNVAPVAVQFNNVFFSNSPFPGM